MKKKVAIVILNYKNWQDTIECLQTVLNITYSPFRVIVVDNDSQNDSLAHIESWLKRYSRECLLLTQEQSEHGAFIDHSFVLHQSVSNRGYAAGNNIGIRWAIRAGDEYVLILNNDTLVEKDFLEPLVDFLDNHPSTAMVGPKIVDLDGNIDRSGARRRPEIGDYFFRVGLFGKFFPSNRWHRKHYYVGEHDYHTTRQVDVISGSCMLMRTEVIKRAGLLDEKTFLYLEEFILHEKLRSLNKTTYIVPKSQIVHKGGQSTKKAPSLFALRKSIESLYHYLRFYRNYPVWFVQVLLFSQRLDYCMLKLKYFCLKRRRNDG